MTKVGQIIMVSYRNDDFSEQHLKNLRTLSKSRQKFIKSRNFQNWMKSPRFSKYRLLFRISYLFIPTHVNGKKLVVLKAECGCIALK